MPDISGSIPGVGRGLVGIFRSIGIDRMVAFCLLFGMVVIRALDPAPVELLRLKVFDAYQAISPRVSAVRPVTIVDIDEASLAVLGQWPWPRTRIADIMTRLKAFGAVVVGFDVVFAEPDRLSPGEMARSTSGLDPDTRSRLEALPDNDTILANAFRQMHVVLGETAMAAATGVPDTTPQTGFATKGPNALQFIAQHPGLLPNIPVLDRAASGRGLFTIAPESDGIVRRVPMVLSVAGKLVPSLSLDILRLLTGSGAILIRTDATGILGLTLPGFQLPTDPRGQIWVHFNAHDPHRYVSAKDVIDGTVDKSRIAGKIILIGASAIGLLDTKTTPVSRFIPGVEIHAQLIESMLTGGLLHEPNFALAINVLIAIGVGLLLIIIVPWMGPTFLLLIGTVLTIAVMAVSWWNYQEYALLVDPTYPLGSSFIIILTLAFMNYVRAQAGRRRIRSAFSQYLSPDLVAELAKSPERLVLGGETRVMSIMFSDVRGFTGISESYKDDPQGLTTLMNRFLTPLTNAIIDHRGTIDKYMGDAIMAFWNAPLVVEGHEQAACRASLDMLDRLNVLNRALEAEATALGRSVKPLDVGIGINTGSCVVGNMGSDLRFDYSVLGDTVNLASRLEGQSKTYGVKIILGESTAAVAQDAFAVIEIDLLQVKGKSQPASVWALLGDRTMLARADFRELAEKHRRMLDYYRARDFDSAGALAEELQPLAKSFDIDGLYGLYRERIAAFLVTPPPETWTGVYTATTK